MKQKILYLGFIFATIFLLIFINRKNNISEPLSGQKIMQQFSAKPQGLLNKWQPAPLSVTSEGNSSITIVKKAKPKEKIIPPANKKINSSARLKKTPLSSASAASSGAEILAEADKHATAGVTKIGKRPSPEQVNELNEQGVIIY